MPTKKEVTRSAAVVMAAILLSRVLGLLRDVVIAGAFGQGPNTDVYYSAFLLPDLLFYLIAGGALSSSFVPVFVEYLSGGDREDAWRLFSVIATVMVAIIGVVVILGEVFARQLVPLVAPGYNATMQGQVAHLTRIVLPAQIFFFVGGLMMGVQWAHQRFLVPGLGPSIYNIGIIAGGVVGAATGGRQGVEGLAWGALAGAFVGNFVMQAVAVRSLGLRYRPVANLRHPGARKVWRLMLPVIFSLSLPQVDTWVNRWFGSFLFAGAVSALDRANRLMQVPIGVFGQAIGIAFFPTLAAHIASESHEDFRKTLNYGLRLMAFVSIPATVLMIILRYPVIKLLFQHGKFTAENTRDVASALTFYSLGIFAWSAQALVARAFYAMQDTRTPVWTGTLVTAIFLPLNWALMQAFGGIHSLSAHNGLALATTIAASAHSLLLVELLRRRMGGIGGGVLLRSIGKISIASAAMGLAGWAGLHLVTHLPHASHLGTKASALLAFFVAGGGSIVVFLIACRLLKLEEAGAAWEMVRKKLGRGNGAAAAA